MTLTVQRTAGDNEYKSENFSTGGHSVLVNCFNQVQNDENTLQNYFNLLRELISRRQAEKVWISRREVCPAVDWKGFLAHRVAEDLFDCINVPDRVQSQQSNRQRDSGLLLPT